MNIKKTIFLLATPLVVLLILLAMFVGLLPVSLKWLASDWLEQQGVTASIESVEIDFFDGVLSLANAKGRNADGRGFVVEHFVVDINWKPLLDRVVEIESIELSGLQLDILQKAKALQVAGVLLPDGQQSAVEETQNSDQVAPWRVELRKLSLSKIKSCYEVEKQQQHFCAQLKSLKWQGPVMLDTGKAAATQPEINSSINIASLIISDQVKQQQIFEIASIDLTKLLMNGVNDIKLGELKVSRFLMFPVNDKKRQMSHLAQFNVLKVTGFHLQDQQKINIKQIKLDGLGASILRDKQGQFEFAKRLDDVSFVKQQDQQPKKKTESPLIIIIDEMVLHESQPVRFSDTAMATPVDVFVTIKSFVLKSIDNSDPGKTSHLSLNMTSEKYGSVEFEGDIQLMSKAVDFDIKGKITGLDLRPVGAYLEAAQGYSIKSGQLNADIKLFASQGKLDSLLLLDLRQLQIKALTGEEKKKLEKDMGLGMPLETALNLLRDSDNSIKLKLPVTGDINNIQLDPSDAINKSMSTAIRAAVINYYTPFGLVTAARGLIDLATALRFKPVMFDAGKTALISDHYQELDKIVVLMTEKPRLHITICGFSNYDDLAAEVNIDQLKEMKSESYKADEETGKKLLSIAATRAEAIKQYLIDKGIAADRLVLCQPEFSAKAIAAVEISI